MWFSLGKWIIQFRLLLLIILLASTALMALFASKVQLSYDFTRAIPTDNEKYLQFESFKQKFGDNGGLLVLGIQTEKFYTVATFNALTRLHKKLKEIRGVENVLSIPEAVMLVKNDSTNKLVPVKIFKDLITNQQQLDSSRALFENLPFYKGLLYNSEAHAYLTGVNVNKDLINSQYTFLEGSRFIINGLQESILWAFLFIALCMLYLFRSFKILICSLIPNVVPLIITAGIMGWAGISLKPSTVLVFSVALGIAIDVTIRFLVNYKQELPHFNNEVQPTIIETIRHTGISIIYTSLVLIAGFIIFCFSGFGGTKALGWLTSLTLVTGTITNLTLLPVLLLAFRKRN